MSEMDPGTRSSTLPAGMTEGRILVIDDEPANTTILKRLLDQAGYPDVAIVNDSRLAVDAYETFRPDIVLLDLHMPVIDGFEILSKLVDADRQGIRPPVLVLTADATRGARERALRMGAADFITKPLDHLEVLLRIRNQLATRFLELELLVRNVDLEAAVDERTVALQESLAHLQRTSEERRELAAALINAQELERKRIAADLHDDSIQAMVAVGLRLDLLARRLDADPGTRDSVTLLRDDVAEALASLRRMTFRLAPATLEQTGLVAALEAGLRPARETGAAPIRLEAALGREPGSEAAVILYRIVQEAVANARRHARPSRIVISLWDDPAGFKVEVADDGQGFEVPDDPAMASAPGHIGIASMRQRAELTGGWLRIESIVGGGTTVTAWVPDADLEVPAAVGQSDVARGDVAQDSHG
jgi:signal transduction histidine kinase